MISNRTFCLRLWLRPLRMTLKRSAGNLTLYYLISWTSTLHCRQRCITLRPHAPCNFELPNVKDDGCERQCVKSGLTVHIEIYRDACSKYKDLLENAKTSYHQSKLSNLDHRQLFREVDKLSSSKYVKVLPPHEVMNSLLTTLSTSFAKN